VPLTWRAAAFITRCRSVSHGLRSAGENHVTVIDSDHIKQSLIQLHWLPVSYSIKVRQFCLMYAINRGHNPTISRKRFTLSALADHVPCFHHPPTHQSTTLYHGYARSSASVHSCMRVLQHGTHFLTTFKPWLICQVPVTVDITLF